MGVWCDDGDVCVGGDVFDVRDVGRLDVADGCFGGPDLDDELLGLDDGYGDQEAEAGAAVSVSVLDESYVCGRLSEALASGIRDGARRGIGKTPVGFCGTGGYASMGASEQIVEFGRLSGIVADDVSATCRGVDMELSDGCVCVEPLDAFVGDCDGGGLEALLDGASVAAETICADGTAAGGGRRSLRMAKSMSGAVYGGLLAEAGRLVSDTGIMPAMPEVKLPDAPALGIGADGGEGVSCGVPDIVAELGLIGDEGMALFDECDVGLGVNGCFDGLSDGLNLAGDKFREDVARVVAGFEAESASVRNEAAGRLVESYGVVGGRFSERVAAETAAMEEDLAAMNRNNAAEIRRTGDEVSEERDRAVASEDEAGDDALGGGGLLSWLGDILRAALNRLADYISSQTSAMRDRFDEWCSEIAEIWDGCVCDLVEICECILDDCSDGLDKLCGIADEELDALCDNLRRDSESLVAKVCNGLCKVGRACYHVVKQACIAVGVDHSFLDMIAPLAEKLVDNPGRFWDALSGGVLDGLFNFIDDMESNLFVVGKNLVNIWLKPVGLRIPSFDISGFTTFLFDLIGIKKILEDAGFGDIHTVLRKTAESGLRAADSVVSGNFESPQAEGGDAIDAVACMLSEELGPEMYVIGEALVVELCHQMLVMSGRKLLTRLAASFVPVGGIVAVIDSAYGLYKAFRNNIATVMDIADAVVRLLYAAADGDRGPVASAMEALVVNAVTALADVLLTRVGDVGGKVRAVVGEARSRVTGRVEAVYPKYAERVREHGRQDKARKEGRATALGGFVGRMDERAEKMSKALKFNHVNVGNVGGMLRGNVNAVVYEQ